MTLDEAWFQAAGPERAARYRGVLARHASKWRSFDDAPTPPPPARVSVLVPTLDEADYVLDAVRSLAAQSLRRDHPRAVDVTLVDSGSKDETVDRARPHVDRAISAPRGKLTALAAGVRKTRGDIIVEADADGWYPPGWLARMVEPFADPRVVGVRGHFVYYDSSVLARLHRARRWTFGAAGNFPGGVRAYRRDAFLATGGFRVAGRDESSFWRVWPEEEWRFPRRLAERGRVVNAPQAVCFKSARRNDPIFVRDARVEAFRERAAAGGRFRDGVTDGLYRARRALLR